jgi:hypothetical protein
MGSLGSTPSRLDLGWAPEPITGDPSNRPRSGSVGDAGAILQSLAMASYEVSIPRRDCSSRKEAVRKARRMAEIERVRIDGRPRVTIDRTIPVIGHAAAFRVTFPFATHERVRWGGRGT